MLKFIFHFLFFILFSKKETTFSISWKYCNNNNNHNHNDDENNNNSKRLL